MRNSFFIFLALMLGGVAQAAEENAAEKPVNPAERMLTRARMQDGWICLYDGETTFGWKIDGDSKIAPKGLVLGGGKATTAETTTTFGSFELELDYTMLGDEPCAIVIDGKTTALPRSSSLDIEFEKPSAKTTIAFRVPEGMTLRLRRVLLKPLGMKSIFNGKDLTGWKPLPDRKSVFSVIDGAINVKDGNGDLQSEWQGDDFVLQLDAISYGEHLNSGIFFRSLPGQFWQGYEVQVRNQWEGDDRSKPVDFGTGGIYRLKPTRRVVSSDKEWFKITLVADGPHLATWIDGYQCTDLVDDQPRTDNARKGCYVGKGCITIQGHDPTTNLSFKNIEVADLPSDEKAK